jgi:hypothetical protein
VIEFKMKKLERMDVDLFDGINNLMDKLERLNADLEIMMREVRSINLIVGNVLENAVKSMGLTVTMEVMSHCSVGGVSIGSLLVGKLAIPNITNKMGVDIALKVDDLLDDAQISNNKIGYLIINHSILSFSSFALLTTSLSSSSSTTSVERSPP